MLEETDQALLERARAGDDDALEALLERHQAQVYRFGMKMCRDPEDAKDVLQDTLLAMARGVRDFRGASSLSTWLYALARSACIKKRRRGKFAPAQLRSLDGDAAPEAAGVEAVERPPDEVVASRQLESALERALGELEPTSREVLVLRDMEGLTAPEVAEVLGLGIPAVKSRLHRARIAVRARLAPLLGGSEAVPQEGPCPDVVSLLSRHLEGEIDADACAEMERHVKQCARCREACDSLGRTLALCHAAGASRAVPAPVQASVKLALRDFLSKRS